MIEIFKGEGGWFWQYVDGKNKVLCKSPEPKVKRSAAVGAAKRMQDLLPKAHLIERL